MDIMEEYLLCNATKLSCSNTHTYKHPQGGRERQTDR